MNNLFREVIDKLFNSYFSTTSENQNPRWSSNNNNNNMEEERAAYKLKGYFDLAKEEIDKGVRAEEWGLLDDALLHYQNAQRILREAITTPVCTTTMTPMVKSYRQKISKWQAQVSERLLTLNNRKSSSSSHLVRNKSKSKSIVQEQSSSLDPKLVEMINSVIVDRSPSVKWEDIG